MLLLRKSVIYLMFLSCVFTQLQSSHSEQVQEKISRVEKVIQQDPGKRGESHFYTKALFDATLTLEKVSHVVIMTGFFIPAAQQPETDGPLGSIFLAESLMARGKKVTILTDSYREVPIVENGDPLIDLRKQAEIAYDASIVLKNPECTYVRKAVYEKLCAAQKLLPSGLKFQLICGLRSLAVQSSLFDNQRLALKKQFPNMNEKELFFETSKFVAPAKTWEGALNVSPHSTGGGSQKSRRDV